VPARKHHQIGPQHAGDRARRSQVRHDAVRPDGQLRERRDDPGRQIEQREPDPADPVLDVVAEDPEEQEIPKDVDPPRVQEHRREHGEEPALVPAVLGEKSLERGRPARIGQDAAARDRPSGSRAPVGEVREMRRFPRDLRVAEEKRLRSVRCVRTRREDRFPEQKGREVQDDDDERDPGEPPGGIVIAEGKHPPLPSPSPWTPGSRQAAEPKQVRDTRVDLDVA
jgi:hypothetical protein